MATLMGIVLILLGVCILAAPIVAGAVAVMLVDKLLGRVAAACLDIGHGKALYVGMTEHLWQHMLAARADTDNAQRYALARCGGAVVSQRAGGDDPWGGNRGR